MADSVIYTPTKEYLRGKGLGPGSRFHILERLTLDMVSNPDPDFQGDTVPGTLATLVNNGGTATLVADIVNGVALLDVVGAVNGDYAGLYMPNRPCAGELNSVLAVRLAGVSSVLNTKIEVGFADDPATDAGIVNSLAANTFNATDGVAWCYDTDDTAYWQGCANQNGTPITKKEPTTWGANNAAPVAGTYQWLIVALRGTAAKFIALDANGGKVYESAWVPDAITAATALSPWVFVQNRSGAARSVRIDYFGFWQQRA